MSEPSINDPVEAVETVDTEGQHENHDTLVLHHARESQGDPLYGEQQPGYEADTWTEHLPSDQIGRHHSQEAGQGKGEPEGEFVESLGEEDKGRSHQCLHGPLPLQKQNIVVTQDGLHSRGHYTHFVALELWIAQVEEAEETSPHHEQDQQQLLPGQEWALTGHCLRLWGGWGSQEAQEQEEENQCIQGKTEQAKGDLPRQGVHSQDTQTWEKVAGSSAK